MSWLWTLDALLLYWLNRWVGYSPASFSLALRLSNRLPWVLAALALTWLWFSGDEGWVPYRAAYTRWQARRRVLSILLALALGFGMARVVQHLVPRPRPFLVVPLQVPILPSVWKAVQASMQNQGAFPSDHAVMFFVITLGLGSLAPRGGGVALLFAMGFSALRVGLGFHWPSDMLGGAALAALMLAGVLLVERRWPAPWDALVALFYRKPGLLYPLGFLVLLDLSQKFAALFGLVTWMLGYDLVH